MFSLCIERLHYGSVGFGQICKAGDHTGIISQASIDKFLVDKKRIDDNVFVLQQNKIRYFLIS